MSQHPFESISAPTTHRARARSLALSLLTLAAVIQAPTASAADCTVVGCPKGYSCETEPLPCPAVDCLPGQECPTCEPSLVSQCEPLPCVADSDCASGMVCGEFERECDTSAAAPCADPDDCSQPPPTECTPQMERACVPPWALPCSTAADCGAGFSCQEQEECACSGSSGSGGGTDTAEPAPAGGAAPPSSDSSCSCQPTGRKACVAERSACDDATDCASGWTCADNPEGVCSSTPSGEASCEPAGPAKVCLPPFYDLGFESGRSSSDAEGAGGETPTGGELGAAPKAGGGCSLVGHGQAQSSLPLLAALGAAVAWLRRRRRAELRSDD